MGYEKQFRPSVTAPAETLGSTAGTMSGWPPVTVVTATATGLVYRLPIPHSGYVKNVVVDYTGATGVLSLVNASTATVFNGSTANIITVSSSDEHTVFTLIGISTSQWSAGWSVTPTTGVSGVTFAASTVTG